jgi:hypothetical protein
LGLTVTGSKRLSEVYYNHPFHQSDVTFLSNTIVHELMHNKLNMDDSMHGLAPFAGAAGGFIQDNMPGLNMVERMARQTLTPTSVDISTMAPAMGRNSSQSLL